MKFTENLKLKMPEQEDFIDIDDINHNTNIIDEALKLSNEHINSLVTDENGVHGLRSINKSLQVFNEGKWENLTATDDVLLELEKLKSKVDRLNDAIFNDITKNPFLIRFDDLNGVIVKKGNFNKSKQRIEC